MEISWAVVKKPVLKGIPMIILREVVDVLARNFQRGEFEVYTVMNY